MRGNEQNTLQLVGFVGGGWSWYVQSCCPYAALWAARGDDGGVDAVTVDGGVDGRDRGVDGNTSGPAVDGGVDGGPWAVMVASISASRSRPCAAVVSVGGNRTGGSPGPVEG